MKTITQGVLIPVCSPCDASGAFLAKEFEASLIEAMQEPVDGVYVCGGTGEGTKMRLSERKLACEIAVDAAKKYDKIVLTQIGANTMRDAVELAEHAAKAGSDGISTVPLPGADHSQQMQYYHAVVDAAQIQTILYYMPSAGMNFTIDQIVETMRIDGVTGIKSSPNDFFFTLRLMNERPEGTVFFNGKDEYLAAATAQGASGGIGMWANVFPKAYASIYRYAKAGDLNTAFERQMLLNKLCFKAFKFGLLPSFECILHYIGRYDRVFRNPAVRYTPEFYQSFLAETKELIDALRSMEL